MAQTQMAPALKMNAPQAFISSYAPRLRAYGNSLLTPNIPPASNLPPPRSTKRGTAIVSYAEDGFGDTDFDDDDSSRRLTGLRTRPQRLDDAQAAQQPGQTSQHGRELHAPVEMQGIWREWMGKPKRTQRTEKQLQIQTALPLNLIPIRVDLEVPAFKPEPPLPTPQNHRDFGIDENLPAYRAPEMTQAYKVKDSFLWNLHEALITPDQFARVFVEELDLPADRKVAMVMNIAQQIRTQLEEYAGIAMHPLFTSATQQPVAAPAQAPAPTLSQPSFSRDQTATPAAPSTPAVAPQTNGLSPLPPTNGAPTPTAQPNGDVNTSTATAELLPMDDVLNPDDTYRCIVTLNINLMNRLYSDKFEWSLLHPPGFAELFAKQTCADLGLYGEWIPAITHAIYEAVLRLKKEACENGFVGVGSYGEIDNDAEKGDAGWRYDQEHLADEWEPKVEVLSKEEIEKREGDRERQIRRMRRETARFSSTTNIVPGANGPLAGQGDYFGTPGGAQEEERMGRGERSRKKKRFRSLSPLGRDSPDVTGFGGVVGGGLSDAYVTSHSFLAQKILTSSQRTTILALHTLQNMGLGSVERQGRTAWTEDLVQ